MRILVFAAALAVSSVFATTSPAYAQAQQVQNPADPYVHLQAGVAFPGQVGELKRGRVYTYSTDGSDASIGYQAADIPNDMTIYVYPARESCTSEHNGARIAILERSGVERKVADKLNFTSFTFAEEHSSTYDVEANGYGFNHPPLVSYLWVGCAPNSDWIVKFRGSFAASAESQATDIMQSLMAQIDWKPLIKTGR